MLPVAVSIAVLAALGLASPVHQQKPRVAVVPLPPRASIATSNKVFDREAFERDRIRMANKYNSAKWKSAAVKSTSLHNAVKRSAAQPFDVNSLRKRSSGKEALTDDYSDGIDERA